MDGWVDGWMGCFYEHGVQFIFYTFLMQSGSLDHTVRT